MDIEDLFDASGEGAMLEAMVHNGDLFLSFDSLLTMLEKLDTKKQVVELLYQMMVQANQFLDEPPTPPATTSN